MPLQASRPAVTAVPRICRDCQRNTHEVDISVGISRNTNYAYHNEPVCIECSNNSYRICGRCGDIYLNADLRRRDVDGIRVCSTCIDAYYSECDRCHLLEEDEQLEENDDGEMICHVCRRQEEHDLGNIAFRSYNERDSYKDKEKGQLITSLRPFGIELEVIYGKREKAAKFSHAINSDIGVSTDGSIDGSGIELQTPPANGKKGEEMVKEVCKELIKNDFKVNRSCGFHVHIDVNDINVKDPYGQKDALQSIWLFYMAFEDVLLSFLPPSRKNSNRFCKSLRNDYNFTEIANADSTEKLEKIWYRARTQQDCANYKSESKHSSRYRGINLHTLFADKHIEIRYHSGTTNARKILEWINLNTSIIDIAVESIDARFLAQVSTKIDIHEKTQDLFNLLGKRLTKQNKDYFLKRQKTFMPKVVYDISPEEDKAVEEMLANEVEL